MPVICASIQDQQNFDPLIDSLRLLRSLFRNAGANPQFLRQAADIKGILLSALKHDYSRVVGSGLATTGSFMNTLVNQDGSFKNEHKNLIADIYEAVNAKLQKHDID